MALVVEHLIKIKFKASVPPKKDKFRVKKTQLLQKETHLRFCD
jgi:hypothetical protein